MLPDIKGTLFWLAVVLVLLLVMFRGCGSRIDRWREHRDERRQERYEHRQDRNKRWEEWREQRNERWFRRRRQAVENENQA